MNGHPLAKLAPLAGFPVTVCAVCYGPHTDLAERFLSSLYRNTDPVLFELRAGLNAASPATLDLFSEHAVRYGNVEIYSEPENVFKNPLMRRMFTERPLGSRWMIWFDDDSYITKPDWLNRLAIKMESEPDTVQWGKLYFLWRTDEMIGEFIHKSQWYRGLPLLRGTDHTGGEAYEFRFATGGFWALRTDIIHQLDWPDRRLLQAHDDFLLGEALRQNGLRTGRFEYGVKINDAPRRNAAAKEVQMLPGFPVL